MGTHTQRNPTAPRLIALWAHMAHPSGFTQGTLIQALEEYYLWKISGNQEGIAMIPSSHFRHIWTFQLYKQEAIVFRHSHTYPYPQNSGSQFHTGPHHDVSHLNAFAHLPGRPESFLHSLIPTHPLTLSLGITSRKGTVCLPWSQVPPCHPVAILSSIHHTTF